MNDLHIIGIDPGLNGGIAIISNHRVVAIPTPLSGKEIHVRQLVDWMVGVIDLDLAQCYIESVHSMPGQGVSSSFKFGLVTGEVRGMIKTMGIAMYSVTPQAWKKVVLTGTDKSKEAAITFCQNAYPNVSLLATPKSKVPHTGLADALCIAHYGMIQNERISRTNK